MTFLSMQLAISITVSAKQRVFWNLLSTPEVKDPSVKRAGLPTWVPDWTVGRENEMGVSEFFNTISDHLTSVEKS